MPPLSKSLNGRPRSFIHTVGGILLVFLTLSGCATYPRTVALPDAGLNVFPVGEPFSPSDDGGQAIRTLHIVAIRDLRRNPEHMAQGIVTERGMEGLVLEELAASLPPSWQLSRTDNSDSEGPVLELSILKAYISPFTNSIRGTVVFRAEVRVPSGVILRKVYRGQEVNVNWFSLDNEFTGLWRECLRHAFADFWPDLLEAVIIRATAPPSAHPALRQGPKGQVNSRSQNWLSTWVLDGSGAVGAYGCASVV